MKKLSHYLKNEAATQAIAEQLANLLPLAFHIHFYGELGSGKTTFVRAFLRALGVSGAIKSPTYSLVEPYLISGRSIFHFDLYRLSDPEEFDLIGGRDYHFATAIWLVEWPEKAKECLPPSDIDIHLSVSGQGRQLEMTANSEKGDRILSFLAGNK